MTDQFELRLQAAYDMLADEAAVEIDPITLAALVARRMRARWFDWLGRLGSSELDQAGAGWSTANDRTARGGSRRRPDRPAAKSVQGRPERRVRTCL